MPDGRQRPFLIAFLCLFFVTAAVQPAEESRAPQLGKAPIKQVLAAMTLEEKAGLVVGMGMGAGPAAPQAERPPELVPGAAGTTRAIPRLGILSLVLADGPAGLRISPTRPNDDRTFYATAFPVGTMLASTWNLDLVRKVGEAMGEEALEYGVDILLGPGLNIHRNPLCGRNFEYFSEDPLITGETAAAVVQGIQSRGVGACPKHFAANNSETNRLTLNTIVSERALREIYLEGFRLAAQKGRPWTVMSSYNLINGTYAAENRDLLTAVLRGDWGFGGLVMTDWGAGRDWTAMMKAGNDLIMPGSPAQVEAIVAAVKDGRLAVRELDRNVERILNIILLSPKMRGFKPSNAPDIKGHAALAREAAGEGIVLLKNESGTLPLAVEIRRLAVLGRASYETITGGTGSLQRIRRRRTEGSRIRPRRESPGAL